MYDKLCSRPSSEVSVSEDCLIAFEERDTDRNASFALNTFCPVPSDITCMCAFVTHFRKRFLAFKFLVSPLQRQPSSSSTLGLAAAVYRGVGNCLCAASIAYRTGSHSHSARSVSDLNSQLSTQRHAPYTIASLCLPQQRTLQWTNVSSELKHTSSFPASSSAN